MEDILIPIVAILSIFVIAPYMVFHFITVWRKDRHLQPDDERMMEDLWRTAKKMERRLDALERLIADEDRGTDDPDLRSPRRPYDQ